MNYVINLAWLPLAIAAALTGCGGGGGGGDTTPVAPNPSPVTVPLSTAFANFVNQTKSSVVAVTGTITSAGQTFNVSGSGTYSESTSSGTFEGQAALQKNSTVTGSISVNGNTVPLSDSSQTYFDTNYRPLGGKSSTGYCVTTSSSPIPVTARVGDNAPWFTQTCYTSSSKLTQTSTVTTSYVVEPDTPSTALVKLIGIATDLSGNTLPITSTFRVTNSGAITRLEDTTGFAVGGDSLTLTITYK